MDTKRCSKCGEIKPINEFLPRKDRPSGFQSWCRVCKNNQTLELNRKKHPTRKVVKETWEGAKRCSTCGEVKPLNEFRVQRQCKDGRTYSCKTCLDIRGRVYYAAHREEQRARCRRYNATHRQETLARTRAYRAAHLEEARMRGRKYNAAHPEKVKENGRKYYLRHPEKQWENHIKSKYGLTTDAYNAMVLSQSGKCAICGSYNGGKSLHIDHDHGTGKVRGLLCGKCNQGLGLFGDDIELVNKAALYLAEKR